MRPSAGLAFYNSARGRRCDSVVTQVLDLFLRHTEKNKIEKYEKEISKMTGKKAAFITGANRGIGLETARELGQKDIFVVLGSRDYAKGQAAAQELKRADIEADALEFDVLKSEHHRSVYRYFEERYGRLDILINNAGVGLEGSASELGKTNTTLTTSIDLLRRTFDANFFGVVALTQTLLPLIRRAVSSMCQASWARSHYRQIRPQVTNTLLMEPRKRQSTHSRSISPMRCVTRGSRSTLRIPGG